jgi:hypothetical protein
MSLKMNATSTVREFAIIKFNTKHRTRDAAWEVAHTIKSPDAANGNALSSVILRVTLPVEAGLGRQSNNTNAAMVHAIESIPGSGWYRLPCGLRAVALIQCWCELGAGPPPPPPKSPSRYAACATMPVCLRVSFLI